MQTLLELIALGLIPGFLLLDLVWQARHYRRPRHWRLRGLLVTVVVVVFSAQVTALWAAVLGDFHLVDGRSLGVAGGAAVGILLYELLHYGYHRLAHRWNGLWRAGHQLHHSAESLDAFGAYYLHPFDALVFTTIASLVFFPVLGLVPEAGVIGTLFLTFNAMFQHANIRTPRWLGYVIQRPESHAVHHGKGIHRYNYSDLPLWDLVFGTLRNPHADELPDELGFYPGASGRLLDLLSGQDLSRSTSAAKPLPGNAAGAA
jgi:sterol desaturase/sphingolipid hydroxylase (fatty acid hydroxylase superfamily)